MPTLTQLRTALANSLATLPNATVSSRTVIDPSTELAGQPINGTYALAWVRPDPDLLHQYDQTFRRGFETWHFLVEMYVMDTNEQDAQDAFSAYAADSGTSSIKTLVEADGTLGGLAHDLSVTELRAYTQASTAEGTTAIGAQWAVEIYTAGT